MKYRKKLYVSTKQQQTFTFSNFYPTLYTDSNMTTTNISPSSIVAEVLRGDNYDDWSACMKSYMLAQDLWDFIEPTGLQEGDQEVDSKALRKKNAAALHAIQISCAPYILSEIRSITSAKDAWDTLVEAKDAWEHHFSFFLVWLPCWIRFRSLML